MCEKKLLLYIKTATAAFQCSKKKIKKDILLRVSEEKKYARETTVQSNKAKSTCIEGKNDAR